MSKYFIRKLCDMELVGSVELRHRRVWMEIRADRANGEVLLTMRPRPATVPPGLSADAARAVAAAMIVAAERLANSTAETGD